MLDLNTDKIVDGLTPLLQANCSVFEDSNSTATNSTLTQPFALRIKINTTEIATVSSLNAPDPVITSEGTGLGAVVKGHLEVDGSDSYITVSFKYPNTSHAGNISCEMSGMDDGFHIVKVDDATMVTFSGPNVQSVVDEFKKNEVRLASLEEAYNSVLTRLTRSRTSMFSNTTWVNGTRYQLSRPVPKNVYLAQSTCKISGGKLLEIDDQEEYDNIKTFLEDLHVQYDVMIGITEELKDGEWRFMESPGELSTFLTWCPGEPNNGDPGEHCASIVPPSKQCQWKFNDVPCAELSEKYSSVFICESV